MQTKKSEYRPNVAAIILNREGKVFLGERVDAPGAWQIPQGGIKYKQEEKTEAALWRELAEELGLDNPKLVLQIIAEHPNWLKYDFPDWVLAKGGKLAKFKGQRQKYFLLRFSGSEKTITLEKDGKREFTAYKWEDLQRITKEIPAFKVNVLLEAMAGFKEYL